MDARGSELDSFQPSSQLPTFLVSLHYKEPTLFPSSYHSEQAKYGYLAQHSLSAKLEGTLLMLNSRIGNHVAALVAAT